MVTRGKPDEEELILSAKFVFVACNVLLDILYDVANQYCKNKWCRQPKLLYKVINLMITLVKADVELAI